MKQVLIDPMGVCDNETFAFLSRIGLGTVPRVSAINYAVLNLGYAWVRVSGSNAIIKIRPSITSKETIIALIYFISDLATKRVAFECFCDGEWYVELIYGKASRIVDKIIDMYALGQGSRFSYQPAQLSRLPINSPLFPTFSRWRASQDKFDSDDLENFLDDTTQGRYIILSCDPKTRELRFQRHGKGLPVHARLWLESHSIAQVAPSLNNQPDERFAAYCISAYNMAANTRLPMLDEIDAILKWPGFKISRRKYRRLIVPYVSREGRLNLLGASCEDPSINLLDGM